MSNEDILEPLIDELLSTGAAKKISQMVETIAALQKGLYSLAANEDSMQLDLLKIGTLFQFFFIDTLASGKQPGDLTEDDWKNIADKVYRYAVIEDGQRYSEFVFSLYANYIDISAETLHGMISDDKYDSIKDLAKTIRHNAELLQNEEITETAFIEACLWLSLEAMIKLLSLSLTVVIGTEYAELAQAVSQLAFEYGRYVLYAEEQAILDRYIQHQYALDRQLEEEYAAYLEEVHEQAEQFGRLIEGAFSQGIHEALMSSAALARAAGVKEEELLTTVEDVDSFFLD